MYQLRGPPSPTMDQIAAPEDELCFGTPPLGLEAHRTSRMPFPFHPTFHPRRSWMSVLLTLTVTLHSSPLMAAQRGCRHLSEVTTPRATWYSKPIKRCSLSGVKMEIAVINPSRRNCFISEGAIIRSFRPYCSYRPTPSHFCNSVHF